MREVGVLIVSDFMPSEEKCYERLRQTCFCLTSMKPLHKFAEKNKIYSNGGSEVYKK